VIDDYLSEKGRILYYQKPPILIDTTLIPFKDVIISDGLHMAYTVMIGGNIARSLKDTYMNAKKSGTLYTSL